MAYSNRRVIVLAFENWTYSEWSVDPYFNSLMNTYANATNYKGFSCLSLPSYIQLTSGSNQGTTGDDFTWCQYNVTNIYDILTANGLTYENFQEGYCSTTGCIDYCTGSECYCSNCITPPPNAPSGYCTGPGCGQGNERHVPGYLYPSTCNSVQDQYTFIGKYITGTSIPTNYTFITPNMWQDGHNQSTASQGVSVASNWLKNVINLPLLLNKPWFLDGSTLVNIVCDDGCFQTTMCIFLSTSSMGLTSNKSYNHITNLSTVMWWLGITGTIGNASATNAMTDLFSTCTNPSCTFSLE